MEKQFRHKTPYGIVSETYDIMTLTKKLLVTLHFTATITTTHSQSLKWLKLLKLSTMISVNITIKVKNPVT